jgi:hypothetical protein
MPGLLRCIAAAIIVLQVAGAGAGRAAASPSSLPQQAEAPDSGDDRAPAAMPLGGDKPEPPGGDKPDEAAPAETEPPGIRSLDLSPSQCESLALGKPPKELPSEAHVETVTFTEPPPITFQLPAQSREALTECSLRASGLTVRVDKTRKVITLLPTGTRSPELPNPVIKVTLKFSEEAATPEPP